MATRLPTISSFIFKMHLQYLLHLSFESTNIYSVKDFNRRLAVNHESQKNQVSYSYELHLKITTACRINFVFDQWPVICSIVKRCLGNFRRNILNWNMRFVENPMQRQMTKYSKLQPESCFISAYVISPGSINYYKAIRSTMVNKVFF